MNTHLTRSLGRSLVVAVALAISATAAHADLTGDFVEGAIVGGPGAFQVDPPSAIVGDPVEFSIEFIGTPALDIDIDGVNVHVFSVFGQPISTGAGEVLVLSNLDGINGNLEIIGIENFMTNEGPDISISDVTFTANSVSLNLSPNIWAPDGFVSFDLVFIPAPSAAMLLGLAGLAGRGRRRA